MPGTLNATPYSQQGDPMSHCSASTMNLLTGRDSNDADRAWASCLPWESESNGSQQAPSSHQTQNEHLPEIDNLMSNAMKKLTMKDREKAMDELHGVIEITEEDTETMEDMLQELDRILQRKKLAKTPGTEAFVLAELQDREYVWNRDFRMKFIRSDRYNVVAAADRMLKYFDFKLKTFGYEKLTSLITLSDLNEDAKEILDSGAVQVMPFPDAVGRTIVVILRSRMDIKTEVSANQVRYYVFSSLTESEDVQRRGIVAVCYCEGSMRPRASITRDFLHALPFHIACLHFCLIKDIFLVASQVLKPLMNILSDNLLARVRFHSGSHVECMYELTTFGIPSACLGYEPMQEWVDKRSKMETELRSLLPDNSLTELQQSGTSPSLTKYGITDNDVLFGKGSIVDHIGNSKLRSLVDRFMVVYESASRREKSAITDNVVQLVRESNGRFLKHVTNNEGQCTWEEVGPSLARKKTAHAFRNRRTTSS